MSSGNIVVCRRLLFARFHLLTPRISTDRTSNPMQFDQFFLHLNLLVGCVLESLTRRVVGGGERVFFTFFDYFMRGIIYVVLLALRFLVGWDGRKWPFVKREIPPPPRIKFHATVQVSAREMPTRLQSDCLCRLLAGMLVIIIGFSLTGMVRFHVESDLERQLSASRGQTAWCGKDHVCAVQLISKFTKDLLLWHQHSGDGVCCLLRLNFDAPGGGS